MEAQSSQICFHWSHVKCTHILICIFHPNATTMNATTMNATTKNATTMACQSPSLLTCLTYRLTSEQIPQRANETKSDQSFRVTQAMREIMYCCALIASTFSVYITIIISIR
eukprot:767100-Hanusia_phi.AAC.1